MRRVGKRGQTGARNKSQPTISYPHRTRTATTPNFSAMAVVNLAASLASIPWMTRVLCALLLSFSALLFLLRVFRTEEAVHWFQFSRQDSAIAFPYLVIVPGVSIWYPWTLVTSAFCETTVTEFLISAISLPLAGRYLERVWGPIEFARFTLIVVVASNVIAWFIAFALFVVLRSEVAL